MSDADTPLTAEEALDRLRQRMIRDLASFLLSARFVPGYEHARAYAESLYLSRQPDLARVYAAAARSSPPPAKGLDVERLVEAILTSVVSRNQFLFAPHRATAQGIADLIAAEYARLTPPVDRDVPREPDDTGTDPVTGDEPAWIAEPDRDAPREGTTDWGHRELREQPFPPRERT